MKLPQRQVADPRAQENFEQLQGTTVQAPVLLNSWVAYDAVNYTSPGFWRDGFGVVHLEGMIKNGTLNAVAFTLPAGYRPRLLRLFAVDSNAAHGRVIVYPTGDVEVTGSTTYLSLDGITFPT